MNEYLLNYHRFEQAQLRHSESPQDIQSQRGRGKHCSQQELQELRLELEVSKSWGEGWCSSLRAPWMGLWGRQAVRKGFQDFRSGVVYSWVRKEERAMARSLGGVEGKLPQKMNYPLKIS